MIILKIIYGIGMIAGGAALIKYRRNVKGWTGNFYWAEHRFGNGGTYFVLILTGLGLMFFGVLYPFGGIQILIGN